VSDSTEVNVGYVSDTKFWPLFNRRSLLVHDANMSLLTLLEIVRLVANFFSGKVEDAQCSIATQASDNEAWSENGPSPKGSG